jgi:hypothetical protein
MVVSNLDLPFGQYLVVIDDVVSILTDDWMNHEAFEMEAADFPRIPNNDVE